MARNMIVRLGIDASSFLQKMIKAGAAAESTGQKIRKSLTADQRSSMTAQLEKMKATYQAIRNATEMEDIDLSRSLTRQIDDAEKSYHGLLEEAQKAKEALRAALNSSGAKGSAENVAALRRDLEVFRESANEAGSELERLKRVAGEIGSENINLASHVGMKKLESDINQLEIALSEAGDEARQTDSFIRRIGDSAGRSDINLSRMVRTIRNVSVVSFGLRIVNGLFGELGTIVRNYISQDAQLQAQVNGLSASMGNALAPAIHLVTGALSYALPYVVGISNAIGQLMGALFGTGWSAGASGANKMAAATGGAAKAQKELNKQLMSFDQINRVESQKDSGGGVGGGTGTAISPIEAKTPAWMERFKMSFTDLFNSSEFQAANIGGKIGMALQTGLDWLGNEGMRFNWSGAGRTLRENFDSFFSAGWGKSFVSSLWVYLKGIGTSIITFLFPELSKVSTIIKEQGVDAAIEFTNGIMIGWAMGVVQWMAGIGSWIKEHIVDPIVKWTKELFGIHSPSTVFAEIGENCMAGLGNGFSNGLTWIQEKLDELRNRVVTVANTLKSAFSFEWRLPHLRLPHLQVNWDPVDNVLAQFFGVTAFPRLSVQWFARGGILDGAQIFGRMGSTLLGGGERGREAILPLDTNTGWMDVLANRIAQVISSDSAGDVNANISLTLDGDVLTSKVIKGLRKHARSTSVAY